MVSLHRQSALADASKKRVSSIVVRTGAPFIDPAGNAKIEATVRFDQQTMIQLAGLIFVAALGIFLAVKVL